MPTRWFLSLFLVATFTGPVLCESVIDVSKEWQAHVSSAPVQGIEKLKISTVTTAGPEEPVCHCESMTVQERLDDATYAFTGMVVENKPKNGRREVVFDVDEIFKGTPKEEMKVTADVTGDGCDLPYEEGQDYLVYAKWEWGNVLTAQCFGTKLLVKAKNELGPSQDLKDKLYIKLRNACMGRIDTACCLASLKPMRAGYYLPEPEEGCPSGMIPDRLRCAGSYTWCVSPTEKTHE